MARVPCVRLLALLLWTAMGSPISKVISLLSDMEEKVRREGIATDEAMKEKEIFCERRNSDLSYSIKKNEDSKEELEARISKADSKLQTATDDLQEALNNMQSYQVNLDTAADVRSQERGDFEAAQKDLMETMVSLERAVDALEREAAKGSSAALLQVQKAPDVLAAINVMVSGAMIGSADADGLTAFLQSGGGDEVDELQAPSPAVYESKSGSIVEMLEDMQDKAKSELNGLRQKEETAKHSFAMMRQSLEGQVAFAQEEVRKLKAQQAELQTTKSTAQKDLEEASSDLQSDKKDAVERFLEFMPGGGLDLVGLRGAVSGQIHDLRSLLSGLL
ncbi:unnamed protein product [Symbiodinium natans]|uniref:Uncharacterized protein n=1 Tax=Symbiodinium natans TaxID=878477 RepID=A0A812NIU7_9DINO|nr:unnamed protein product [Symbiodinium natans]